MISMVDSENLSEAEVEKDSEDCETTKYEPPVIEELLTVTANVLKLFKFADISKGEKGLISLFL